MPIQTAWYAVQARANFEQLASTALIGKGYEVLLPTYVRRGVNDNKSKNRPLFPGYLFCRMSPEAGGKIVTSPGVIRVVTFAGNWIPIDDIEMETVRRITTSLVTREPWRYIPNGVRVRIENGPLKGVTGVVESNGCKLVVSVTLLQRAVAVKLDHLTVVSTMASMLDDSTSEESRIALELCGLL